MGLIVIDFPRDIHIKDGDRLIVSISKSESINARFISELVEGLFDAGYDAGYEDGDGAHHDPLRHLS